MGNPNGDYGISETGRRITDRDIAIARHSGESFFNVRALRNRVKVRRLLSPHMHGLVRDHYYRDCGAIKIVVGGFVGKPGARILEVSGAYRDRRRVRTLYLEECARHGFKPNGLKRCRSDYRSEESGDPFK